ncbi:MAG: hypothetical protein QM400_05095 [Spirochaetota bacterium]|nr:hypothetical protein [Spirochaetota bacterium]
MGPSFFTTCTLKVAPYDDGTTHSDNMELEGTDNHGYTCNYFGQLVGAGSMIYQYDYYYSIKDADENLIAESTINNTITVKFFLTQDGKLFVEFDRDSDDQFDPGPLDGVMLTYGEKQA